MPRYRIQINVHYHSALWPHAKAGEERTVPTEIWEQLQADLGKHKFTVLEVITDDPAPKKKGIIEKLTGKND